MPTRDQAPLGAPCWIELFTSDPDTTRPFYEALFGWKADEPNADFGGYVNFMKDGTRIAGSMHNDGSTGTPDAWSVYLATADAEATAAAMAEHGGQVVLPAMPVGDMGSMTVGIDPGGAMIGAWQPASHPGFTTVAEPGAPDWFELHTRSYDQAVTFYEKVFGWDTHVMSDAEDFRYTTLGEGDDALAGVMDDSVMEDNTLSPHWAIYFNVADTDATIAQITELGGSVIAGPHDSPFGRLAEVADPAGTQFRIVAE